MEKFKAVLIRILQAQDLLAAEMERHGAAERAQHDLLADYRKQIDKLTNRVGAAAEAMDKLSEHLKATSDSLTALHAHIKAQDEVIARFGSRLSAEDLEIARIKAQHSAGISRFGAIFSEKISTAILMIVIAAAAMLLKHFGIVLPDMTGGEK